MLSELEKLATVTDKVTIEYRDDAFRGGAFYLTAEKGQARSRKAWTRLLSESRIDKSNGVEILAALARKEFEGLEQETAAESRYPEPTESCPPPPSGYTPRKSKAAKVAGSQ
jgi:hypothetical protein